MGKHDVKIGVKATTICGGDLHIFTGRHPAAALPVALAGMYNMGFQANTALAELGQAGIEPSEAAVIREPSTVVHLDGKKADQCIRLLEILEDHDDVDSMDTNLDVTDELMNAMEE